MCFKKYIQLSLLFCGVIVLAGCGTSKNYALAINSWEGAPESALQHTWGEPERVTTLANGNRLYVYRTTQHETVAEGYSPAMPPHISPQNNNALSRPSMIRRKEHYVFWCETEFEVNHAGMIVNTHFQGNNCVASQQGAERWAFAR